MVESSDSSWNYGTIEGNRETAWIPESEDQLCTNGQLIQDRAALDALGTLVKVESKHAAPPLRHGNVFVTKINGLAAMAFWEPQITWFAIIFTRFQAGYPLNLQVSSPWQDRMGVGRLAKVETQTPLIFTSVSDST